MTPLVEYPVVEPGFFPGLFANGEEQPDFDPDKKKKRPPAKKKAPAKKKSAPAKKKAPARKKK